MENLEIKKDENVVYVFGDVIICERINSVRVKNNLVEIKLGNGWAVFDKRFHKVPKELKEGVYSIQS